MSTQKNQNPNDKGEIIIYQSKDGLSRINVKIRGETVQLTQAQLVELYQTSKANVSEHIKHIFEEGGLEESSVVRNFRTTAADGKTYNTKYYNLDAKATQEYRKYEVENFSPVEESYLKTLTSVEKTLKKENQITISCNHSKTLSRPQVYAPLAVICQY